MSDTVSLPGYAEPQLHEAPLYTAEPDARERRIAHTNQTKARPTGNFVKQSKSSGITLKLAAQDSGISLPVYGMGGAVEGTVDLSKTEGITSVEVKIDGKLRLREIAEGGTTSTKLCLDAALLWVKDSSNSSSSCPNSLPFCLNLPTTFSFEGDDFPLPPTHEVSLMGLPGFQATVAYTITAIASKGNSSGPSGKSSIFGINIGGSQHPTVTTPFVYYPRTRPAESIPVPLEVGPNGLLENPYWRKYTSSMRSRINGGHDVQSLLFIPTSRFFCMKQPIPFHLVLESSPESLAILMAFGPTTGTLTKKPSRIKLMRQSTVDVRNELVLGTKTDIWRVDPIGEGSFKRMGEGPNFIAFSGEIIIQDNIKIGGFKAAGLTVKDWVLLSITPPEAATKAPFTELRQTVPIRLTTDEWIPDGSGLGVGSRFSEYSIPSSPGDSDAEPPLSHLDYDHSQ